MGAKTGSCTVPGDSVLGFTSCMQVIMNFYVSFNELGVLDDGALEGGLVVQSV